MDFDEYVAARYGRLIEHAVLLGCAEGEAGTQVDEVLLAQRKQIQRAEDPDPLVHEALERSISGAPERRSRTGPLVALGLVLVAVAVGVVLTYRPPPKPMPSLFALDGDQAQKLLEDQGYDVLLRPARACEPQGLVLGSDPPAGTLVQGGATVTVRTAAPSGSDCVAYYQDRSDAWTFLAFALGQKAPKLADPVRLLVAGSIPRTLDREQAADRKPWTEAFDLIAVAAHTSAHTTSGMPGLTVRKELTTEPVCGVLQPADLEGRAGLRLEIDPRPSFQRQGCPLTVDLYRDDAGAIDTVVVYPPKDTGGQLVVNPAGLRAPRSIPD
jgi:hypothetical protein